MATEHEVDRMVVRLIGDQAGYQKMLKDVEKQTQESASWAEKQGSRISEAFNKAFRSAQGMMSSVGSTMQKAGAASLAGSAAISAPLGKAALDFSEYGKSIADMVRQSEQSAKKAAELKKGILEGTEAFKELSKVVKLTNDQAAVFQLMSKRTGESVEELTKNIKTNSAEYETWRKEAEKFGLVMGEDAIKDAKDLAESWVRVKQAMSGMWAQVGAVVAKGFKEWNDLIIGVVTWTTKWIKENKDLIATVAKVAEKLMFVGGALVAVGTALTTISTVLGPLTAMIVAGAAAWLAWDTATGKFLQGSASQIWQQYGESIKSVLSTTIEYGKQIIAYTDKVMTGVYDAVKAGNLELAIEILWAGAKVAWITAIDELDKITSERFGAIFQNLAAGNWKSALEAALNEVLLLWNKLLLAVDPIFTQIVNKANTTWTEIVNGLDTAWVSIQNVVGMIQAVFKDAADNVMVYWTLVKTFFTGTIEGIKFAWGGAFDAMLKIVGFWFGGVGAVMSKVKELMKVTVSTMATILSAGVLMPVQAAMKVLEGAGASATDLSGFKSGIAGAASATNPFSQMSQGAFGMAEAALGASEGIPLVTGAQDAERQRAKDRKGHLKGRKETRTAETEVANAKRLEETYVQELQIKGQIIELEERQAELLKQGQADAAAKLEAEQEALKVKLAQSEAEAKLTAEEAANASNTQDAVDQTRVLEGEYEKVAKARKEAFEEQYDPVTKYMKRLKELNSAFKEAERGSKVYTEALKDIREELASASFNVELNFSTTGLEAVKGDSAEFLRIAEAQQEAVMVGKARDTALAEAGNRQAAFDAPEKELEKQAEADMQAWFDQQEAETEDFEGDPTNPFSRAGMAAAKDEQDRRREEQLRLQESIASDPSNPFNMIPKDQASSGESGDSRSLGFLDRMAKALEKMVDQQPVKLEPLGAS